MPERIQLRRTKGWRKPEGAVSVARGTDWGNPYAVGHDTVIETQASWPENRGLPPGSRYVYGPRVTPAVAVLLFRIWIADRLEDLIREDLRGKDLACWCPLDQPCHADVLLEIANEESHHG